MKKNILRQLIMLSKRLMYAFLIQLVMCTILLANTGNAQRKTIEEVKVSMNLEGKTLSQFFRLVESKTDFKFTYNDDLVDLERKVTIDERNQSLYKVLGAVSRQTDLHFVQVNENIHVKSVVGPAEQAVEIVQMADVIISGTVTDENGEPIPGVTVSLPGTTVGTATDLEGGYSLTIPEGSTLVFSFIGFETQTIEVGDRSVINVALREDMTSLDEVVVVGYGEQKKVNLTGSVINLGGKELEKSPSISLSNSFAGRLPGVVALNRSGEPGEDVASLLIRGKSTLGNTSPLIVIDGVWGRGGLNQIDPRDVESISVLKDASAAIYGAQAANGVILITTKRGKSGKPSINYSFNQGVLQPTRLPEMADAQSYAKVYNDLLADRNEAPRFSEDDIRKFVDGSDPIRFPNTNWVDATLKNHSLQSRHNLSISGGSKDVNYYVSGNLSNQNSIFKNGITDYKSFGFRSNIDAQITDFLKVSLDFSAQNQDRVRPGVGTETIFNSMWRTYPFLIPYYPNGLPGTGIERGENPALMVTDATGYRNNKINQYQTTFRYEIDIPQIEGISIDGFYAFDKTFDYTKNWNTPWKVYEYDAFTDTYDERIGGSRIQPQLREQSDFSNRWTLNSKVNYAKSFGNHNIGAFVAFEQTENTSNYFYADRRDYTTDALDQLFAGSANNQLAYGSASASARRNYFGRMSYNFQEKYLVDFNFRYDGSSNFPKDSRWGFFPGISAAWRISEEEFFKVLESISSVKIRASWGQIGNDLVPAFQYLTNYGFSTGSFFGVNHSPHQGIVPGVSPNPHITWEVANTSNIGLDLELQEGKFGFTLDLFKTKRSNILTKRNVSVPIYSGLDLPDENIGVVENKGFELEVLHRKLEGRFNYQIGGNLALAKNKVLDIDEPEGALDYQRRTGMAMDAPLYFKSLGIYLSDDEIENSPSYEGAGVGDLQYEDINKDGIINAADRIRMNRTSVPEITFGFNYSANYNALDFAILVQGVAKAWRYIELMSGLAGNTLQELADHRWTPENQNPIYPNLQTQASGFDSDFWLKDASFVRLKNLEIGYTLPNSIAARTPLKGLRIYLNGLNLLTFDKLKWFDPEGSSRNGATYPQNKIYNLGINISL